MIAVHIGIASGIRLRLRSRCKHCNYMKTGEWDSSTAEGAPVKLAILASLH
jgi:hypothetical protein